MSCKMLGSYRVPDTVLFQYGTVYHFNVVPFWVVEPLWYRCGCGTFWVDCPCFN